MGRKAAQGVTVWEHPEGLVKVGYESASRMARGYRQLHARFKGEPAYPRIQPVINCPLPTDKDASGRGAAIAAAQEWAFAELKGRAALVYRVAGARRPETVTLTEAFDVYAGVIERERSASAAITFRHARRHFEAFCFESGKGAPDALKLDRLDDGDLINFVVWLDEIPKRDGSRRQIAGLQANADFIAAALNAAQRKVYDRRTGAFFQLCVSFRSYGLSKRGGYGVAQLVRRRAAPAVKRFPSAAEWGALFDAFDISVPAELAAFRCLLAGLYTGGRSQHLLTIDWRPAECGGHLDLDYQGMVGLHALDIEKGAEAGASESKRRADVRLSPWFAAHAATWGGAIAPRHLGIASAQQLINRTIKAVCARAGLPHFSSSMPRHRVASVLRQYLGADHYGVKQAMGHEGGVSSGNYVHRTPGWQADFVASIDAMIAEIQRHTRVQISAVAPAFA